MDVAIETQTIEREIHIAATPETVWELLVDPQQAIRWMGMNATFDVRRGGAYSVDVIPGHTSRGEFVEIDPPRKLVYTWGWEKNENVPPGSTTIEFELIPKSDGTLLRFAHRGLPTPQSAASHTHGWEHYLARLERIANGNEPGPDPWVANPPM
jgi:uncharacterized protein YndB with AHSA1/START domain